MGLLQLQPVFLFQGKPVYVNYGLKADFQKIQKLGVLLNGTIIIFRAGKITLAEKVSSLCPKTWPNLAAGSYASSS